MRKNAIPAITAFPEEPEYVQAACVAARCTGTLPSAWLTGAAMAVLALGGMLCFSSAGRVAVRIAAAAVLFATAAVVGWLGFRYGPEKVRRRARKEYEIYKTLRLPMRFSFEEDAMETASEQLRSRDSYARLRVLAETPELLIFCKDGTCFFVLPKRCLPAGQEEETLRLLRLEFARHRRVMRSWLF